MKKVLKLRRVNAKVLRILNQLGYEVMITSQYSDKEIIKVSK